MLASKILDLTSSYIFWYIGHLKTQKNGFFRISHNNRTLWCRRPNMGSTMRKLTSRRFQKCGTYRFFEFLNGSYGCSKSTESEIFYLSPKIGDVTKKDTASISRFETWYEYDIKLTMWGPYCIHMRSVNGILKPCLFFVTLPLGEFFSSDLTRLWQPITLV